MTLFFLFLPPAPFSLQQFCGVLGHTFMEFLKGSGDYCQAQHDLYADKWTVEIHYYSTKKPP